MKMEVFSVALRVSESQERWAAVLGACLGRPRSVRSAAYALPCAQLLWPRGHGVAGVFLMSLGPSVELGVVGLAAASVLHTGRFCA